jgi:hypothetical protein
MLEVGDRIGSVDGRAGRDLVNRRRAAAAIVRQLSKIGSVSAGWETG